MFGIYDPDYALVAGPFTSRGTALFYAIEHGIGEFKIEEM